ncbi:hypothetical protein L798_13628 [Zootermopsis nevadensis]|uniref:DUF659 domain-containing protein n=1 Tax=Zootermopsis nevadensis TaxID=136037 RepID=A0A067QR77_ZOONE|nr:hypothetical protein L798_13628 [Zootermopsis nevadensis]
MKYMTQLIPDESTLSKNCVPADCEDVLKIITCTVGDNKIWVSVDETTDVCSRHVANVVIGTLFANLPGDLFLLDTINHSFIVVLFDNAMKRLLCLKLQDHIVRHVRFSFETLKMQIVIYCNAAKKGE